MARGRVKHVLFNPSDPGHVKAAEELGADISVSKSSGVMLQFFEGKPSGYIEFDFNVGGKDAHISHIFVKPELRDTVPREKMPAEERSKKMGEIFKKYIDKGKEMNKRDRVRMDSIRRADKGLKRSKNQLLLGAKLVKSLNTKLGLSPSTTHGTTPEGMRHITKYMPYSPRGIRLRHR
ncbi:hypothetical protein H0N95_03065 [Candidatus Micrarchaeota archaeon]|nr:hypothetical protein [Candidatus Micrarchaeota archaeon]